MATKSKSKSKRKTRSMGAGTSSAGRSRTGARRASQRGSREDSGNSGRTYHAANGGIRVKTEMSDPKVARIVIEIAWTALLSRVARKMGRGIQKRAAGRTGRTRRASASS